jgi:glycosyltransferase involved in cell wall biosynthesis
MDKLRVAVIMENCAPTEGGGYSYYDTLLTAIDKHSFHPDIEIVNLNLSGRAAAGFVTSKKVFHVRKSGLGSASFYILHLFYRLIHRVFRNDAATLLASISAWMDAITNKTALSILRRENIDLIYYLKPQLNLIDFPMIVTHWDVGHKSMFPFPEVASNVNNSGKENYYKTILSKALLILCESEAGKRELMFYYPVNPRKLKVLPLFAGGVINLVVGETDQSGILSRYNLHRDKFYLYPAQFWAHKNHAALLHAFRLLLNDRDDRNLKLVFCGGDQGNLGYIQQLVKQLALEDRVVIPGFINNTELYTFYKNALSLVMPTYLGPTNIPLIEAAELACAVICSDHEGHKEILGSHALYFNPSDVESLRENLEKMLDERFRKNIAASAYLHIKQSRFQLEKSVPLLDLFLQQLKPVRKAWGKNLQLLFAFLKVGMISLN